MAGNLPRVEGIGEGILDRGRRGGEMPHLTANAWLRLAIEQKTHAGNANR